MNGYVICLEPWESEGDAGWQFCMKNKSRWKPMNFEESSIDFTVITAPRFVIDDISYDCKRQYFIRVSDTETSRLLILAPFIHENENGKTIINKKHNARRYTGADGYYGKREDEKDKEESSKNTEENPTQESDS